MKLCCNTVFWGYNLNFHFISRFNNGFSALTWCRRHSWRETIENKRTRKIIKTKDLRGSVILRRPVLCIVQQERAVFLKILVGYLKQFVWIVQVPFREFLQLCFSMFFVFVKGKISLRFPSSFWNTICTRHSIASIVSFYPFSFYLFFFANKDQCCSERFSYIFDKSICTLIRKNREISNMMNGVKLFERKNHDIFVTPWHVHDK